MFSGSLASTTGWSTPNGYDGTWRSRSLTSRIAASLSVPGANSSRTRALPCEALLVIARMPATPCSFSSCFSTIDCSISSGEAPGQVVETLMMVSSTSGVSWTGTRRTATSAASSTSTTATKTVTG